MSADIGRELLRAKQPCADGFRWYLRHGQGLVRYQALLDGLVAAGRVNDACWLLDQIGPTADVQAGEHLGLAACVLAGGLEVNGAVEVDGLLRVGASLWARGAIRAGRAIEAGDAITAVSGLRCEGRLRCGGALRSGASVHTLEGIDCGELQVKGDLYCDGDLVVAGAVRVDGELFVAGAVRCGGDLRVGGDIVVGLGLTSRQGIAGAGHLRCGEHLEARWGVRVRGSIAAQGAIRAGESLVTEGTLEAGPGYGIYAGLDVRAEDWPASAQVRAAYRPAALRSGWWVAAPSPPALYPVAGGEGA